MPVVGMINSLELKFQNSLLILLRGFFSFLRCGFSALRVKQIVGSDRTEIFFDFAGCLRCRRQRLFI